MKSLVNQENKIPKAGRTIIKCDGCGFKYYEGDVHKCGTSIDPKYVGVVNVKDKEIETKVKVRVEEDTEVEKKKNTKTKKEAFKLTW